MSRVLVAGVDTSTQSTKVRVTDAETGEMVRFGQAKHPDGTSVNPDAWWQAFQEAAEQAGGLDDVAALAVGGQQHGMVLLDDHGRVIRDALLWNDTRSATNADVLIACLGEAEKAADGSEDDLSDDPAMRGRQRWVKAVGSSLVASLTITKVAWVAANEPENAARIAAICLPHDWLSWRIAGHGPLGEDATAEEMKANLDALFTDRSDASGTAYFDATANEYRRDLLAMALGRGEEDIAGIVLPRVLGPTETGDVADPAIAGKDVEGGCPIGPGGGDNAMASLGLSMGVGDVSISLGTSVLKLFDLTAASTGLNEKQARAAGVAYDKVVTYSASHASYYPGARNMTVKTLFDPASGRILGAQIVGFDGVDKRMDVLAAAIRAGLTAEQLTELDLAYAPPYGSAKDPVNMAGYVIENVRAGLVEQHHWDAVAELPADGSVILLDVRTPGEVRKQGLLRSDALHIPLDELRGRLGELDKGKKVYVNCYSGLRSYLACRILSQHGFQCSNLSGGWRFWSYNATDRTHDAAPTHLCGVPTGKD